MHGYYDDDPPGIFRRVFGPTINFFGALRHEPLEWLVYETPRGVFWFCATTLVLMCFGFTDFSGAFKGKFAHVAVAQQPAEEFADDLSTESNPFSKPAASEEYKSFLTAAKVPEEEAETTNEDEDLFAFVDNTIKPAATTEAEPVVDEVEPEKATPAQQIVAVAQKIESPAAKTDLFADLFDDDPEEKKEAAVKGKALAETLFPEKKKPEVDNVAQQSPVPKPETPGNPVATTPKPEPPKATAEDEDLFADVVEKEEKAPPATPATEKPESTANESVVEAEVESNPKRQPEPKLVRDDKVPTLSELNEMLGDKPRVIIEYLGDLKENLSNSEPKPETKTAEVKSSEKKESNVAPVTPKEKKQVAEVTAPAQQAVAAAPTTKPEVKTTPRPTPPTEAHSNANQQKKTAPVKQGGHWEERIERQVICHNGRTCSYVNVRVRVWIPASPPATRSVATNSQPQRSHSAPVVCGQQVRYSNCAQVQNTGYSSNQNEFRGQITQHRQQRCNAGGFRPFKRIGNFLRGGQRWR